jgi:4-hydroxybenzoate polyprenyltransferase
LILNLVRAMRPRQWSKNVILFAPLLFTYQEYWRLFSPTMWRFVELALAAFAIFCVLSGVVYLVNDLVDVEKDRVHPTKRLRPIASGALGREPAIAAVVVLLLVAVPLAFWLNLYFAIIALLYLVLQFSYSFWLKHVVIMDVFAVATGFVLRAVAGAAALEVRISPWLFVVTILFALFLTFSKRRHELVLLENNAPTHRAILREYTRELLDEMIAVVTASTVMAYSLYTFSAENLPKNHAMMLTIPFVLYGIFRYLYLIHVKNQGGSPEEILLKDRPIMVTVVLWALTVLGILYLFGRGG